MSYIYLNRFKLPLECDWSILERTLNRSNVSDVIIFDSLEYIAINHRPPSEIIIWNGHIKVVRMNIS